MVATTDKDDMENYKVQNRVDCTIIRNGGLYVLLHTFFPPKLFQQLQVSMDPAALKRYCAHTAVALEAHIAEAIKNPKTLTRTPPLDASQQSLFPEDDSPKVPETEEEGHTSTDQSPTTDN